ncbi:DUF3500 domain-containing protein [Roseibium sp. SCP14]|uniref:DUF3500 domain-containing protein n=1 Tax=Roseibium sp. SCP14 TaxID=3141375 RepID=UPI00333C02F3
MKPISIVSLAAFAGTLMSTAALAHNENYKSHGAASLASCAPSSPEHTPAAMAASANGFLKILTEEQRQLAQYELDSPERYEWTNVPARGDVGGLRLGDLETEQMQGFCDLLASLLSGYGFEKIRSIMQGDDLRSVIDGEPNTGVGIEAFRVSLFGDPSETSRWGVQLDGHHIALNFTLEGEHYSMSPSFIGTYPKEFTVAGTKLAPMAGEVDLAYQFLDSLTDEQRADAVVSDTRGEIQTGPGKDGVVPAQDGLNAEALNGTQTGLLLALASQWLDVMPPPHARATRLRFLDTIDSTTFSWSGSTEQGKDISYRIQGPSIIIEFANDLRGGAAEGGDPTNHIHTMYRDIENDYGQDW